MRILSLLVLSLFLPAFGDTHYSHVVEGNREYEKGDYSKAANEYTEALRSRSSDAAKFNLGNSLYKAGEHEKAASLYSQVSKSPDKSISDKALLNFGHSSYWAGTANMNGGDLEKAEVNLKNAAASYRKSLLENPADLTVKKYLEHTLAKLKELEKMKQENQDKEKQEKDKKEDDKNKDGEEKEKSENPEKEKSEEQRSEGEEQEKQNNPDEEKADAKPENADKEKKEGELKPEEMERILNALEQDEKKVQTEVRRKNIEERSLEKDW